MKKLLAIATLMTLTLSLAAQQQKDSTYQEEKEKKFDPNRLVFGGIVGASFGNITFVQVAPQVGYMFNQYLTAGGGINFIYSSQKLTTGKYEYGYAGLNVFARAFPLRFIVVSAQPELNYNWGKFKSSVSYLSDSKIDGQFIPSLLLGGGLVIPTGGRGGMMLTMQYDVIQNPRSPYGSNAFINVGFTF